MMPNIRIDRDVYEFLQQRARAFVDTPNTVLRRLLGLDPANAPDEPDKSEISPNPVGTSSLRLRARSAVKKRDQRASRRRRKRTSAVPAGSLLPEADYVIPLLTVLAEHGGTAPARQIIETVGERLESRLSPADRETLPSGIVRWQNRVQFVRLRLVEEGLLSKDSPRGVWALTTAGQARAAEISQRQVTTASSGPELVASKR